MGCFNHKGSYSNLPIKHGDRIVVIVGIRVGLWKEDLDYISPGQSFTPLSLPIRGEYDDYGGISMVDDSYGTRKLEEFFGHSASEIVSAAERFEGGCGDQVEFRSEIDKKLKNLRPYYYEEGTDYLGYVMEHEEIFDEMVKMTNIPILNERFWQVPKEYMTALGFSEKKNGDFIDSNGRVLQKNKTIYTTIEELIHEIDYKGETGIFKQPWYDAEFSKELAAKRLAEEKWAGIKEKAKDLLPEPIYEGGGIFTRSTFGNNGEGLFSLGSSFNPSGIIGIFDTLHNEQLSNLYKDELIDLVCFIGALKLLDLPWGRSGYVCQDVIPENNIMFVDAIFKVIKKKKGEWEKE